MEKTHRVTPLLCDFELEVPSRNADWYTQRGYEPFSTAVFRSSALGVDVVVDIGAHVGYFSLLAASANPAARVVAVEASPDNVEVLRRNLTGSAKGPVELLEGAFGDSNEPREFQLTEASDNSGASGHPNSTTVSTVTVEGLTGQDLKIQSGQRVLVKLDVEGHELAALEGLQGVLDKADEVRILVEFNPKCVRQAGLEPAGLVRWLVSRDYRIFLLDESARSWQEVQDDADEGAERLESLVGLGYANLYCLPRASAISVVGVLHSSGLGGAERSHIEFVEDVVSEGGIITTVVPGTDRGVAKELERAGSSVHAVPELRWWALPAQGYDELLSPAWWMNGAVSDDLIRILDSVRPDLVLTQTGTVPEAAVAAAACSIPHVWWLREFGDLDHRLKYPLAPREMGRLFRSLSHLVLTNSAVVRDHFFGPNTDGVTVSRPRPRGFGVQPADRPDVPWTFSVVGTLHPGKGQDIAIRALATLTSAGRDVRLRLVGESPAEELARLKDLATSLDVVGLVEFLGHQAEPLAAFDGVSAVVVASTAEAFGRVPFEAADAHLPVVYGRAGGIMEYMEPGETGLEFDPGNPADLADQLTRLIQEPNLAKSLAANWRSKVMSDRSDRFGPHSLVHDLRDVVVSYREREGDSPVHQLVRAWVNVGPHYEFVNTQATLAQVEGDLGSLRTESARIAQDLASTQRELASTQRELASTQRELASTQRELASTQRELALTQKRCGAAEAELESLRGVVLAIESSRSWRLTAPYRSLGSWLKVLLAGINRR